MSRKPRSVGPVTVTPSPPQRATVLLPPGMMLAWLTALLVARWLIPTEGADTGMTLWLVQLALLTAVVKAVWEWRFGERPWRGDALDLAMTLLVVAQGISALAVVFGNGDARAALNVAWEWVGSAVLIGMLRRELTSPAVVRAVCTGLILIAGVLAGLGVWQHYVGYETLTREYDRLTAEHDRLVQSGTDRRRMQELRAEMARLGIPDEPGARQLFEQRLKQSREPLGFFALANTFAGLLMVMLLIVLGWLRGSAARGIGMGLAAMIGFCLLLTKSRTAWVGLLAGLGWWAGRVLLARWQRPVAPRAPSAHRRTAWIVVGVLLVSLVAGIAVLSGGLDKAVLSEAPKSLRYRLEYWQGTWGTIREHWWLGTGPGNFRDHYLAHKLPESSEEIADPHNFVLDVWANAGTVGLVALFAGVVVMIGRWRHDVPTSKEPDSVADSWRSPAVWGAGCSFLLAAFGTEFFGHGGDDRLWWLAAIWCGLWSVGCLWTRAMRDATKLTPTNSDSASHSMPNFYCGRTVASAVEAASVALLVHLLGAGGIAMPAITQLLWLLWSLRMALSASEPGDDTGKSPSESGFGDVMPSRFAWGVCAVMAAGAGAVCWWTATQPELLCRTSLQLGDAEWQRGQLERAQSHYAEAARVDPWAVAPLERQAEVAFQRWQLRHRDDDFELAINRWEDLAMRQPFASRTFRRMGQAWQARFEHSRQVSHAAHAAAAFAEAVKRYPHHAELLAEWAFACELAGQSSQALTAARRAIQQDDLNRQLGHTDKFLAAERRQRLLRLASPGTSL